MQVKPAPGLKVRDPRSLKRHIVAGEDVNPNDIAIHRLLATGDLVPMTAQEIADHVEAEGLAAQIAAAPANPAAEAPASPPASPIPPKPAMPPPAPPAPPAPPQPAVAPATADPKAEA